MGVRRVTTSFCVKIVLQSPEMWRDEHTEGLHVAFEPQAHTTSFGRGRQPSLWTERRMPVVSLEAV